MFMANPVLDIYIIGIGFQEVEENKFNKQVFEFSAEQCMQEKALTT